MSHYPNDKDFTKYLRGTSWVCPAGGAHSWVGTGGFGFRCTKCEETREFRVPDRLNSQITVASPGRIVNFYPDAYALEMRQRRDQPIGVAYP